MQSLVRNSIVNNDIKNVYEKNVELFKEFEGKTFYITGGTGVIGNFLVQTFLFANKKLNEPIKIILPVRNVKKAEAFFSVCENLRFVKFIQQDVTKPAKYFGKIDYIIHCASNTSSQSFVEYPIETMDTIIQGTKNILDFAKKKKVKSMVYLSSMEVYGELEAERGLTHEEDLGYIDILKPRSSYQVGKRTAESYCSYYAKEKNVPVKIARLAQIISSNISYNDSRVIAYFARCVYENKDIVLNTLGEDIRSYCYISDVISALFTLLAKGNPGESYNIANSEATRSIKEVAQLVESKYKNTNLRIELKDKNNYPTKANWKLDSKKLENLGWNAQIPLETMIDNVISSFYKQNCVIEIKQKSDFEKFLQWLFLLRNDGQYKTLSIFGKRIINYDRQLLFKLSYLKKPIKKQKIVINNFNGKNLYGCHPKYIIEEMKKRKLNYEIVWLLRDIDKVDKTCFPKNIKIVDHKKREALKELSEAKIILSNVRNNLFIQRGWIKKSEQVCLQTWHGSLGIKRIGTAVDKMFSAANNDLLNISDIDGKYTDYIISNSDFEDDVYKNCYCNFDGKILKFGHPRNDIFYFDENSKKEIKQSIYNKYSIDENKKIVLYVPTFRDNYKLDCYQLNSELLLNALKKRFGNDFVLMVRMHPHLKYFANNLFNFSDKVVNVSEYPDIQELLVSADIAITDYSSCIFDYMLSRNPGFIFATDIKYFNNDRGFFYPLETTPFPIAKNNEQLINNILNFDEEKYRNEVEVFLNEKGCMEDGLASKRVVDLIENIIKN